MMQPETRKIIKAIDNKMEENHKELKSLILDLRDWMVKSVEKQNS